MIFIRLYLDPGRSDCWSEVENRLIPLAKEVKPPQPKVFTEFLICSTPTENKGYSSLSDLLTSERLVEKIKEIPHNIYLIWFNYIIYV